MGVTGSSIDERGRIPQRYPCVAVGGDALGKEVWRDPSPRADFYRDALEEEIHMTRRKRILETHPEVRELYAPDAMVAVQAVSVAILQLALAYLLRDAAWWLLLVW